MDAKRFLNSTILNQFNELSEEEQKEVIDQLQAKYLVKKGYLDNLDSSKLRFPSIGDTEPEFSGAADEWNN